MIMRKKALIIISVLVVAIILVIVAIILLQDVASDNGTQDSATERSYAVETIIAKNESNDNFLSYTALIQPRIIEQVTFTSINTVKEIYVSEGDKVSVGHVLVLLDESQARQLSTVAYNEMIAAENAMNVAKLNYDTALEAYNDALNNDDVVVDEDTVQSQLNSAIANRDKIQAELDEINESLAPYIVVRDNAQNELNTATEKYNAATEALEADPDNEQKKIEQENALEDLNTKTEKLSQAQSDLSAQEDLLNKNGKEAELATAETAVDALQSTYDNLQDNPIVSSDVLYTQSEAARLTYEASKSTHSALKETYEATLDNIENLTYKSTVDGTVLTVISTEGSVVTPLAPVMVIGSDEKIAQFGISSDDSLRVRSGVKAKITIKGEEYDGEITNVSALPDEMTRTYLTDVSINDAPDGLLLGEVVYVDINLGETSGIWVPLNIVLNDGEDYLFVVENERASRKNIEILEVNDDKVLVSGINEGDLIISQGMKTLKSGYKVSIIE